MQLGFVSAILPDLTLEEVLSFAADEGFGCVELMCWPPGQSSRRYAGITHVDVTTLDAAKADGIKELAAKKGVAISGLGYYPNPLDPDLEGRRVVVDHLKAVIRAAPLLGVHAVNTFIGRDWRKSIDENWPLVQEVWPEIIAEAKKAGVKIGIENCPMLFSKDEWPGGKNLAVSPAVWRKLFNEFPDGTLGLNFDPSHLIFQQIDYVKAIREFGKHFVHVHAKDTRVDMDRLYETGNLGLGWHTPKLPGLGDVHWGQFFSALSDTGYTGAVCIEVEDRAYEGDISNRKRALTQSKRYLEQFM
ncbi:sugar phosphate isomerase/epimerase family protein [Zavarzinella formosa]|uniref:sugar phosphate isomerase/epimerase family protein n=1 Tax=Zavarzinella formosa TaxID=360055 RepID=UPI00030C4998|nr:sugar phosphate isomerase/epimerase [Zavarzinella formosa]